MNSLFQIFKAPTLEERVRSWKRNLKTQQRLIERSIRQIEQEEAKVKTSIKVLGKKNEWKNAKTLAKELVRSKKQKTRLSRNLAQLKSLEMQLQHQITLGKVAKNLQKSTEIMKLTNQLMKVPQLNKVIQEMSMEMTKAGIMEDMVEDTLDQLDDLEEEEEEEVEEELNRILSEVTNGRFGEIEMQKPKLEELDEPVGEDLDLDEMTARLEALKS